MARGSSADADAARALAHALSSSKRYVRSGVRSIRDVRDYLSRRGVSPERVARVIRDYQARGLLDDQACAKLWAEHWSRFGYAWAAIEEKLSTKGLDGRTIARLAQELGTPAADAARARAFAAHLAVRRRAGQPRSQLARRLASHGFDADVIERLLGELTVSPPSE